MPLIQPNPTRKYRQKGKIRDDIPSWIILHQGVLAPGWHQLETTATSYFQQIQTLSLSDCWSVANLEKILMHRNAETSVVCGEMGLDVRFHCLPGGYAFNLQQVKHKFGDGVGLVLVWCLNVRGIQRCHHVI